jgi:hypothetical protein
VTAEQEALLRELREQIGEATVADLVQRVEQLAGPSLWWLLSLPVAVVGEVLRRVGAVVPGLPRCEGADPEGDADRGRG